MSENQYHEAIASGLIQSDAMSVYKIIKYLYKYDEKIKAKYSKRKCNDLVTKIRKNRNNLIHGNKNVEISYQDALNQIKYFEQFMSLFNTINL